MAKENPASSSENRRKPMSFKSRFLLILTCLFTMAFFRTGFVFLLIALLPSIIAYYLDMGRHRYMFHSIFAMNMAGLMPFIGKMVVHGPQSTLLEDMMGNLMNWVLIYGAALIGLFLVRAMPMFAYTMIHGFHQAQIARLTHNQKRIENEWGPEAAQFSRVEPEGEEKEFYL